MKRVDLREVWKNEARDFTSWLFDNIEILGEELNISITSIEKEKNVGSFSADILAENEEGDQILIESIGSLFLTVNKLFVNNKDMTPADYLVHASKN